MSAVEERPNVGDSDVRGREIAEKNTILKAVVGSFLHGLGTGEDDTDEMGVCVEPATVILGLEPFEQHVSRTQPEGVRSGPGDLDSTIYGLRKYVRLALKGNPSILLMLYARPEDCSIRTSLGAQLQEQAPHLVSKQAGSAFLGFIDSQRGRMMGERGRKGVNRPELVERYGYDTKYAGHVIRLALQGVQLMQDRHISLPMPIDQRKLVLAVRNGQFTLEAVNEMAEQYEAELKRAIEKTLLPDKPDVDRVVSWLVSVYPYHWIHERSI